MRPRRCSADSGFQSTATADGSLPVALPRQSLHEAAGDGRDDDDAHEEGGGDADDQGDEQEVASCGHSVRRQALKNRHIGKMK